MRLSVEEVNTPLQTVLVSSYTDNNLLIWDEGKWDEQNWAGFTDTTTSARTFERVVNYKNTFYDMYVTDTFIDSTNSTGSIDTSNGTYTIDSGEQLVSRIIAKNNESYSTIKITLTGTNTTLATIFVQFDGTNWESVTDNTWFTSSYSSTNGIKYKITNSSGSTITLTKIKIQYS